ncbi:alpha/beta hydrolase [Acidobacteria bacterium AH-259-A15]|nr:alpha/beta hydrolase [Acidobacteria bacterium AH-259-A15]
MWLALGILLVALIFLVVGFLLALWWIVPRLENLFVFRPTREVSKTPAQLGIPFDQYFIETSDGCRLSAWHMRPSDPLGSIIYFHGNGGNLGLLNEIFDLLFRFGLEVLAVDYRGYGWSSGTPSEKGLYQDTLATVTYFHNHLRDSELPLLYWGRSLGSCFAAYAASQVPPDGLILETGFASKASLVKYYPQFRAFYPFSRCRLETLRYLKDHLFPVLVIHGDRDRTIPSEEGRALFEGLTRPKEFYCVKGADHVNVHRLDSASYMRRVLQFVKQVKPSLKH